MLDFSSQMIDVSPLAFATIFCLTDESTLRWRNLNRAIPRGGQRALFSRLLPTDIIQDSVYQLEHTAPLEIDIRVWKKPSALSKKKCFKEANRMK